MKKYGLLLILIFLIVPHVISGNSQVIVSDIVYISAKKQGLNSRPGPVNPLETAIHSLQNNPPTES